MAPVVSAENSRIEVRFRIGQQGRGPILVGNAEPPVGILEVGSFFLDRFVALLLHRAVEHADEAFVQDVVAERLWRAVARDQPIGIERDRRGAFVVDAVLEGEQVLVVDPNGAMELEPLAVVIDKRDRMADLQRDPIPPGATRFRRWAASGWCRLRQSSRTRHRTVPRFPRAPATPTIGEFGSTVSRYLTSERSSSRAPRRSIDPLTIGGVDLNARRCGEHLLARLWRGGGCGRLAGSLRGVRAGRAPRCRPRSSGCCLHLLLALLLGELALPVGLRRGEKILPANQHDRREDNRQDGIFLVLHGLSLQRRSRAVAPD